MRNFQNVDVTHTVGKIGGESLILDSNSDERLQIHRTIGERLRGPRLQYMYKEGDYVDGEALGDMIAGAEIGGAGAGPSAHLIGAWKQYGGHPPRELVVTPDPWLMSNRRGGWKNRPVRHGLKNGDVVSFVQDNVAGSSVVMGQSYYVQVGDNKYGRDAGYWFRLFGNSDLSTDPVLFYESESTDSVGGMHSRVIVSKDKLYSADHMELKPLEDAQGRSEGLPKYYKILNKSCAGVNVIVRVPMLSETLMTGPTAQGEPVGKGDNKQTSVTYRIDYRPFFSDESKNFDFFEGPDDDGQMTNPKGTVVSETIRGKVSDGYARMTEITFDLTLYGTDNRGIFDPTFLGWEICIYRETFDSFTSAHRNQTFVDSLTEIYEEKYCYPNTAFVRHRFRADTFQAVPKRTHLVRGLQVKIPNNYNPIMRTYGVQNGGSTVPGDGGDSYLDVMYDEDGNAIGSAGEYWNGDWKRYSDGTIKKEWTDNPAWIYHDIFKIWLG
jgi:hypothetical protein